METDLLSIIRHTMQLTRYLLINFEINFYFLLARTQRLVSIWIFKRDTCDDRDFNILSISFNRKHLRSSMYIPWNFN